MKWLNSFIFFFFATTTFADGIESKDIPFSYKAESVTTEPETLPDPVDQPPVLDYGKPAAALPVNTNARVPASQLPHKYVDAELGIACYYFLTPTFPGVLTPSPPAISCVSYQPKIIPVLSPQNAQQPATTN